MQVSSVEVDTLFVPVTRPYSAGGRQGTGNWHVLARVTTSDGVQGHGYIVALRQGLVAAVAQATRELGAQLVGMHVLEVEAAWERLASVGDWVGPGGLLHYAIAPLDIALWDAAGKTLGQPLYRLLGGYRDRVPAYASDGLWYSLSLDELAESASGHVAHGYTAIKMRLGHEARQRLRHGVSRRSDRRWGRISVSWSTPPKAGSSRRPGRLVASCRRLALPGSKTPSSMKTSPAWRPLPATW